MFKGDNLLRDTDYMDMVTDQLMFVASGEKKKTQRSLSEPKPIVCELTDNARLKPIVFESADGLRASFDDVARIGWTMTIDRFLAKDPMIQIVDNNIISYISKEIVFH